MTLSFNDTILVADVGGTNVRLGLAKRGKNGKIIIDQFRKIPGDAVDSLSTAIHLYLKTTGAKPKSAALALAGPIAHGQCVLTNRDWTVSAENISKTLDIPHVNLYNDFAAMARSAPELDTSDFDIINSGTIIENTPILVAGPGTGFGMAILIPVPGQMHRHWTVLATEGGHVAYTPQTVKECEILQILQEDHDFVSLELVSSGKGMDALHAAVCKRLGQPYEKTAPALVLEKAVAGDEACLDVCEIRAASIMTAVGDMALTGGTRSGVILAGGVTDRLMGFINTPNAMARYYNRGPRSPYMKAIPIRHLHKPSAALYGAAALYLDEIYDY